MRKVLSNQYPVPSVKGNCIIFIFSPSIDLTGPFHVSVHADYLVLGTGYSIASAIVVE